MMSKLGMLLVLAVAGCGAPSTQGVSYEVRLRGVNAADAHAVFVDIKDLQVSAGGRVLATTPPQRKIDLTRTDHAWLLGTFVPPLGTDKVHVEVMFDDYGAFENAEGAGWIDAKATALRFDAPVAWLQQRGHATIELDLARSLVQRGAEERRLVPQVRVLY